MNGLGAHSFGKLGRCLAVALTWSLVLNLPAYADDSIWAPGGGEIRMGKTDKIAMAREVLEIGLDHVSVDFDFVNESDSDVIETLFFPLPEYGGFSYSPEFIGQPMGFKVLVDGKPAPFRTVVRAFTDEGTEAQPYLRKDVTTTLKKGVSTGLCG